MLEELEEHLGNNPGFTGTIELYGDMVYKTQDRYYAIAYCKDGKFHREDGHAIYLNYKDIQYVADAEDGIVYSSKCFDLFDDYESALEFTDEEEQDIPDGNWDIEEAEAHMKELFDKL